jgi:hypothetical protein
MKKESRKRETKRRELYDRSGGSTRDDVVAEVMLIIVMMMMLMTTKKNHYVDLGSNSLFKYYPFRHCSVGIATGYMLVGRGTGDQFSADAGDISSLYSVHTGSWLRTVSVVPPGMTLALPVGHLWIPLTGELGMVWGRNT